MTIIANIMELNLVLVVGITILLHLVQVLAGILFDPDRRVQRAVKMKWKEWKEERWLKKRK